ncbi:MAG: hypothetical protein M1839_000418 [Geoglossum umbratile]|nr:MAG: hypothetical protein M1839_000418 [Geoglossum umbratile]
MGSLPEAQERRPVIATKERRLIIAIDYGTTYTGVAIATPLGNVANIDEIDIIKDWGPEMGNHDKIPSIISYSPASNDQEQQWGSSLSPEAVVMVHTKLELDVHSPSEELDLVLQALDGMYNLHFQQVKVARGLPEYTWKGPAEIVEDYLTKLFDSLLEAMERLAGFEEELRALMPVDIVVTIPAVCHRIALAVKATKFHVQGWPYRAKNSTFRALTRAGFNKDTFPKLSEMLLVSEPEAAAIYTARYLKQVRDGADFLRAIALYYVMRAEEQLYVKYICKERPYVLTVVFKDVVSYKVKELQPTFEVEAVTLATGHRCGSIFIDLAFKKWLRDLLGEKNYQKLDQAQLAHKISSHHTEGKQMRQLMKGFNTLKFKFRKDQRDMKMDLPDPLHNLDMDNRVVGGEITITNGDMRSFFDPCVDEIVELIQGQAAQIERLRIRLKHIFLVGGFAESRYLQDEIRVSLQLRQIQLHRPDTSWTAVVRGAAIFGIEKSTGGALSAMNACPRNYGISVSERFSEIQHDTKDHFIDPHTGISMARNQLMWLIKKGDLLLSDEAKVAEQTCTVYFSETGPRDGKILIYTYDDEDIPERFDNSERELLVAHTLEYNLTNFPLHEFKRQQPPGGNQPFYIASLKLTMRMIADPRQLEVELCWKETVLYGAVMDYF